MITKNVIVLVLLLGNMTSLSAQYFGSPDCHWIYDRSGRDAFTEVVFDSDTVINNQVYNEFDIRVHTARVIDTVVGSIMSIYLNNTNGLVTMSYDAIKIDTLIDYNAVPGDTWTIYHDLLPDCYLVTVIDTFTVTFAGRSYSALSYNHFRKNSSPTTFIDTIYEHWGFRHDFILPYDWYNGLAGNNVGGGLLCFTNDAVGTIEVGLSPDVWLVEPFPYECDEMPPLVDVDEPSLYLMLFFLILYQIGSLCLAGASGLAMRCIVSRESSDCEESCPLMVV